MKLPDMPPAHLMQAHAKLIDDLMQQVWDTCGYGDLMLDVAIGCSTAVQVQYIMDEGLRITKVDILANTDDPSAS